MNKSSASRQTLHKFGTSHLVKLNEFCSKGLHSDTIKTDIFSHNDNKMCVWRIGDKIFKPNTEPGVKHGGSNAKVRVCSAASSTCAFQNVNGGKKKILNSSV